MTSGQLQQVNQRLSQWRARHADTASLRAAYRQKVMEFVVNSMALENEPVDRSRVEALRTRSGHQPSP